MEKLSNLKPLSHLHFKRGQRKNALASEGKSCRPETMTAENQYDLCVMTSQIEMSTKNHI